MSIRSCRRMFIAVVCVAVLGMISIIAPANAQLYGLSSSTPGSLYTIDPATGAATFVTDLTGTDITSLVGLDFLGGVLYATDVIPTGGPFSFGSIDLTTGAFTAINDQGGSANWHGLAGSETLGVLFTIDINDGDKLKSVTPGGLITTIGSGAGIDGRGMAYDDNHGILYASGGDELFTVDTTTGTSTLVGALGIGGTGRFGMAYDPFTDTLYGNSADTGNLYTIDVSTGLATAVGPNGPTAGNGIDGLGFNGAGPTVPEPGAMAGMFAAGVAFLGLVRRRRA